MNLKSIVFFSLFGITCFNGNAQNPSDELLRINDIPFTVGEFERIYNKNLNLVKDEQQKNIDNYLDLFVLYKLKVAKAYDLKLNENQNFINEFESHKKQLSEQYLTNQETLDKLAKEAFDRSKEEIKASHIIFLADELSSPADTLKAYNKAIEVRNLILNGLDFSDAAVAYSEDPSAKENKGDLGYFSSLRMVYPFETGAYQTPVGAVSMPVKSQFGYHLIQVNDRRFRHGKREIAQIYLENKEEGFVDSNKIVMDKVYQQLLNGGSFEDLVVKYSDDMTSKSNKGILNYYEPGLMDTDNFDEAVFDLKEVGSYSKPFKSQFGWHIVKLVAEEKLPEFDEKKEFYIRKIQSDNRSRIITEELVIDLKKKYNFKLNTKNYKDLVKYIEKNVNKLNWLEKQKTPKSLAVFANKNLTVTDFISYIEQKKINFEAVKPIENGINYCFDQFVSEEIIEYYNANLENQYPEFRATVQEFKEGLLLFELLDNEIWKKVQKDTIGYTNFYQTHLNKFIQKESIQGTIFQSDKKSDIRKIQKYESKNFGKNIDDKNKSLAANRMNSKLGKFLKNDTLLPKNYVLKKGVSDIFEEDGKFYLVVANEYFPERVLDLEEIKQDVIYEYQQEYEKNWINNLLNSSDVKIDNAILKQLKSKYHQN